MKAKTKVLLRKLEPAEMNVMHRVHNADKIFLAVYDRIWWRNAVLHACDNFSEMFEVGMRIPYDRILFPSKRRLNHRLLLWASTHRVTDKPFHIIRQGKRKWRIVKRKYENPHLWYMRTVEVDMNRGWVRKLGKNWNYMGCTDFGCDTCMDQGFCRTGHSDKSFCDIARKCGLGTHGNAWWEVTEGNEKSCARKD